MDRSIVEKVIKSYIFSAKKASIQFWNCTPAQNGQNLSVVNQPHRFTRKHKALDNHRESCHALGLCFVGPETKVDDVHFFAGIAAETGFADQLTCYNRHQFMGQLVVPVYNLQGVLLGVIELITFNPVQESYAADFNQIHRLLKDGNLATKAKEKQIKVDYGNDTIKFKLPFSAGITCLWEEVTMRFRGLNQEDFQINYEGCKGKRLPIINDDDLWVCMSKSGSKAVRMFIA